MCSSNRRELVKYKPGKQCKWGTRMTACYLFQSTLYMYSVYTLYQRGRNVAWIFTETKDLHVSNNHAAYDFSSNVSLTHAFIFDY